MTAGLYGSVGQAFGRVARLAQAVAVRARHRALKAELAAAPGLATIYRDYRSSPEGKWTIEADDVLQLYETVKHYRPERILELGMGIGLSTASMALALKELGLGGHITSLEQASSCIRDAKKLLPDELAPFVTMVHASPTAFQVPGVSSYEWFCGYDWRPQTGERFDMLFLDGPAGWVEDDTLVALDSGDLYQFLPYLSEGAIVYVDGRRGAVRFAERYLGAHYRVVAKDSEHTLLRVLHRAGAEPLIEDRKRAALGEAVYRPKELAA